MPWVLLGVYELNKEFKIVIRNWFNCNFWCLSLCPLSGVEGKQFIINLFLNFFLTPFNYGVYFLSDKAPELIFASYQEAHHCLPAYTVKSIETCVTNVLVDAKMRFILLHEFISKICRQLDQLPSWTSPHDQEPLVVDHCPIAFNRCPLLFTSIYESNVWLFEFNCDDSWNYILTEFQILSFPQQLC